MIKVLHIITSMSDGGAQRIVINYAKDFTKYKDFDTHILSIFGNCSILYQDDLNNCNVDCLDVKTKAKGVLKKIILLFKVKRAVKAYLYTMKPDIVHIHLFGTLKYCLKPIKKAKVPLRFYTLHSAPSRFAGYRLRILQNAFKKEKFIPICVTYEQAKFAKNHYKFNKHDVIHNGVDFEKIKANIISQKEARKKLGLNEEEFVICAVGRLEAIKRYDFLIRIFNNIISVNKNAKLVIAGDGPKMESLKTLSESLNVGNNVKFLGNIKNIVELYCASNVLAITSESESASLVLLEAQACNLRCVISDGVPSESIITNRVKKMLTSSTIEDWTEALLDLNYTCEKKYDFCDYEVHKMSEKLKNIYIKYWKEYVNEK